MLNAVVSIVSSLRRDAVKSRLFSILCIESGYIHETPMFRTEIRWLSRGKVLKNVIDHNDKLGLFLHAKSRPSHFSDVNERV
jgi:hypothetical protein